MTTLAPVEPAPVAVVSIHVPPIFVRGFGALPPRVSPFGRLIALVAGVAFLVPLVMASQLDPSGRGVGTHEALGLQPCGYQKVTGIPCPTCGCTTAFSWYARGQWLRSFYTQPLGMLLALLVSAGAWAGFYVALSGRPVYRLLARIPARYYVYAIVIVAPAAWGWKIVSHLAGWQQL